MLELGVPGRLVGGDVVDEGGSWWRTESLRSWGRELDGIKRHDRQPWAGETGSGRVSS
jgi:hypothetical protein